MATAARAEQPVSTKAEPENIKALEAEEATLVAAEQKLVAEHNKAWAIAGDPPQYSYDPIVDVEPEQRLLAKDRLNDIPKELRLLRARLMPIRRRLETARAAERETLRDKFSERKRRLVAEGDRLVTAFADWNARLVAVEDEENAACGTAARFSWMEFMPETALTGSRLESWRRHCREHGMLD